MTLDLGFPKVPPPYRLFYGAPGVAAPAYDFARLPAGAIGLDRTQESQLGAETLNEDFEPPADTRTFFERNPNVVNGLLSSRRSSQRSGVFSRCAAAREQP